MRDAYLFIVFLGTMPAIFFQPHVGILVWTWISYMSPQRYTWGVAYDFRFGLICAAATIVAWVMSREPVKLPRQATAILLILLLFWIQLTTTFALAPDSASGDRSTLTKVIVMTLVALGLMHKMERIHAFVWLITVSIGFYAVKGGIWFVTGGVESGGRVWGPPGTFIEGNNELALAIAMVIPLMLYLRAHSPIRWIRLGFVTASLLSVIAIIGSFSRGALLATIVLGLMLVMRSRNRFWILILVLLSGSVAFTIAPESWFGRIQTITEYKQDASSVGRLQLWEFGWKLALERPVLGGGFRAFDDPVTFARLAPSDSIPRAYHNIYIQMLADHGFVGLGIYLLLWVSTFVSISRIKSLTRTQPDLNWANDLVRMIEVSLSVFAVGGLFYSLAIFDLFYHLVAIVLLVRIVVERELGLHSPNTKLTELSKRSWYEGRRSSTRLKV